METAIKEIVLNQSEINHLLKLLEPGRQYYAMLAGNTHCSNKNREAHRFIEELWRKLNCEN